MTEMIPLRRLASFFSGGTPSKAEPLFWRGDIPWVSPKDMGGDEITDAEDHISPEAVAGSATKVVPENSILVVVRSGILVRRLPVALTARPVAFNQDIKALVVNAERCLPEYVFWCLRAREQFVLSQGVKKGATVHSLSAGFLEDMALPVPPIPEQRRIVDILNHAGSIRRLRKEARAKAREIIPALFVEMFGDPATNPKGWPMMPLFDVLSSPVKNGLYLPKDRYVTDGSSEGVEMVHMADAFYGIVKRGSLRRVLAIKKQVADYALSNDDILIARRSLNFDGAGKACRMPASVKPLIFESSLIRLSPNTNSVKTDFLYYYLNDNSFRRAHVIKHVAGITIHGVNQAGLKTFPVLLPPLALQQEFAERVAEVEGISALNDKAVVAAEQMAASLMAQMFESAA